MNNRVISQEKISYILHSVKIQPSEKLESSQVEFKNYNSDQALFNAKELSEEISAFANNKGGVIIIGVIDSSNIKNQKWELQLDGFIANDLLEIKARLEGRLKPKIDLLVEEVPFENNYFLVIHIPKITDCLVGTSGGKYYIRDGRSSRPLEPKELEKAVKSLQFYDWSADEITGNAIDLLDKEALEESYTDFCERRGVNKSEKPTKSAFLESIGATRNGKLNKGGLLFLGKESEIKKLLGNFEFRFSRKTNNGKLLINNVWSSCIWHTVKKAKGYFEQCNILFDFEYQAKSYSAPLLDPIAFHEAYLNAIVHRDYSIDGMTSVNFINGQIIITSPGSFYGGITPENIAYHEPRHRNKVLAKILMTFQLVDRAGMGVLRMGLKSLEYGRGFPRFEEKLDSVEVIMQAEFIRPAIFVVSRNNEAEWGIIELLVLNLLYEHGYVTIKEIENKLNKITTDPWGAVCKAIEDTVLRNYAEFCGDNEGVYLRIRPEYAEIFGVKKIKKAITTSDKHVKLYKHLKKFKTDSNSNIKEILGYSQASSTSTFLKKAKYVCSQGESRNSVWLLIEDDTSNILPMDNI